MKIGIISDTHNVLSRDAMAALRDADRIVHAGDIGSSDVIAALETIAPVIAVRGNMDGAWARQLPHSQIVSIGNHTFYILHDQNQLDLDPSTAGIDVVICGHTHQADIRYVNHTLFFNPGSASISRHGASLTIGFIKINNAGLTTEIVTLAP